MSLPPAGTKFIRASLDMQAAIRICVSPAGRISFLERGASSPRNPGGITDKRDGRIIEGGSQLVEVVRVVVGASCTGVKRVHFLGMGRYTSTEVGGLIVAAFLFIGGACVAVWPREGPVLRATMDASSNIEQTYVEFVGKNDARLYGVLAMLLGSGIAAFIVFPIKR